MKRCEDCKFWKLGPTQEPCNSCIWSNLYIRTPWLGWLWLVALIIIITLALLLGGCSQTKLTLPDGSSLTRTRFMDSEKIGSVSYDDGSFTLDGYESDLTKALGIIERLIASQEVNP